jgi:hypothetical protein
MPCVTTPARPIKLCSLTAVLSSLGMMRAIKPPKPLTNEKPASTAGRLANQAGSNHWLNLSFGLKSGKAILS